MSLLTSRSNFLTKLYKPEETHGTAFYDTLTLPPEYKDKILHRCVLNNTDVPTLTALRMTYGNRVPASEKTEMHGYTCPEDFCPDAERKRRLSEEFRILNDPSLTMRQRLDLWDYKEPGFILGLFGGLGNTPAGIGCIASPVCTQGDAEDTTNFGAPNWSNVFDTSVTQHYLADATIPSHCIVGALGHETWKYVVTSRTDFIQHAMPVVMPDGKALGCKPGSQGVFQLIFIPFQGEAPVGVFMNPNTTYDAYLKGLANPRVYQNFLYLLRAHETTFRPWFDAVNANQAGFKVPLLSATTLWNTFPTADKPDGENLLDMDGLEPFVVQQNRFCRSLLDDAILRAPMGNRTDEVFVRCRYRGWRDNAQECYPVDLGTQRPMSRQAFLSELLPPMSDWPEPFACWREIFSLTQSYPLPEQYRKFGSMKVPGDPSEMGDWVPTRLTVQQPVSNLAAFFSMRNRPRQPVVQQNTVAMATPAAKVTTVVAPVTESPKQNNRSRLIQQLAEATKQQDSMINEQGSSFNIMSPDRQVRDRDHSRYNDRGRSSATAINVDSPPAKRSRTGFVKFEHSHERQWNNMLDLDEFDQSYHRPPGTSSVFSPTKARERRVTDRDYDVYQQPLIMSANGTLSKAKYALVRDSDISSAKSRRKCSPQFLQLCLLSLHGVDGGSRANFAHGGYVDSGQLLYVTPPTHAGINFLTGFDHGNNGEEAVVRLVSAIKRRWRNDTSWAHVGLPVHEWKEVFTPDLVKRMYTPTTWAMDTDRAPPTGATKKFSLLALLPLLDPTYGTDSLPPNGVTWRQMCQLSRFVYYIFSFPFCKMGRGHYDDEGFAGSVFGKSLYLLCRWINNTALERLWMSCPTQCTVEFITDLSQLFQNLYLFVEYRMGDASDSCGIGDVHISGKQGTIVAVSATMEEDMLHDGARHYLWEERDDRRRLREKWARNAYNPREDRWRVESVSPWLSTKKPSPTDTTSTTVQKPPEREAPDPHRKTKTPRDSEKTPFVNKGPIFEYIGDKEVVTAKDLMKVMRDTVSRGDYPKIIAQGNGGKKANLCLSSAFKGNCFCANTKSCRSRMSYSGYTKERVHIDLTDAKWSSTQFPGAKWEFVVAFLQKYRTIVKPTTEFKKLTPSTQWE